ncbi:MAG: DUF378 domain-containing protein [Chlamydiales bacterium]
MKIINVVAMILLIIGGLNWGLVAFDYNIVEALFGGTGLDRLIYILVGLSAIWEIFFWCRCKTCTP